MTRRRIEPLIWLMFSGGGVLAAVLLPVLAVLFALALPLGWVSRPSHDHLVSVLGNPLTQLVLTGLLRSLLFGITSHDPLVFAGNAALLFAVAGLACLIPAFRATRSDPMVVLRAE